MHVIPFFTRLLHVESRLSLCGSLPLGLDLLTERHHRPSATEVARVEEGGPGAGAPHPRAQAPAAPGLQRGRVGARHTLVSSKAGHLRFVKASLSAYFGGFF